MPLTKMGAFSFDHSNQQDDLYKVMSALEIKQAFDSRGNELKTALNNLIDALNATTSGDSGAKNIGATSIAGLTGNDVQTLLEALKTLVDTKANLIDVYSKTDLQSVADGNSGADKIGVTPISTSPSNLQGLLEWLKQQIDSTILGQIPDGSITPSKLSFDPATQTEIDEHKNDATSHITSAERTNWNGKLDNSVRLNDVRTYSMGGMV